MENKTLTTSKEWKERWEVFWMKYYTLSTRRYVDKRGRNKDKEELLSPRERYWESFKSTFAETYPNNKSKDRITYIPLTLEERAKNGQH